MKKLVSLILVLAMTVTLLAACGSSDTTKPASGGGAEASTPAVEEGKVYRLKLSSVLTDKDPIITGMKKLAEDVAAATDNKLQIEVYPSSQLGDTPDVLEQALSGSNVGVIVDTGVLADYVPDMAIYSAPYVFDSVENARKFIETDIFKSWDNELAKKGLRDLGCNWFQGSRSFMTNKKVGKPEDLKGLRIRTMGSEVAQESMKAMMATPTSLAWSEVYSGMQSNVIDGLEAQTTAIYGASLQEVAKYIALTEHFHLFTGLVISENWFQSLPAEYQKILVEKSIEAGDYATKLVIELEDKQKEEIAAAGVEYVEVDKKVFKDAAMATYEKMGWQDLKAKIDAELGQ